MTKLSFDYDSHSGNSVAEYHGLTIKAVNDSNAGNPWDEWEGNAPLIVNYDGRLSEHDSEAGFSLSKPFASGAISDALLRRHMGAIAAAFGDVTDYFGVTKARSFAQWLHSEAKSQQESYGGSLTDCKRELLQESLDGMNDSERLETLAAIYQAIGWQAETMASRGYSQGDYVELLFVATPHFVASSGAPSLKDSAAWARDFKGAKVLFSAWAWGDVYGFVIESADGDHLDSCWGFYGRDFDESGLAEAAQSAADHILSAAKTRRLQAVKRCVVNRVPLNQRAAIISAAAQMESA